MSIFDEGTKIGAGVTGASHAGKSPDKLVSLYVTARLHFDAVVPAGKVVRITPVRGDRLQPKFSPRGTTYAHRPVEVPVESLRPLLDAHFTLGDVGESDLRARLEATVAYKHLTVRAFNDAESLLPGIAPAEALLREASEIRVHWTRGEFSLLVENAGGEDVRLRIAIVGRTPAVPTSP